MLPKRSEHVCERPTCLMDVTVITKKRGRPLVTGLVGVSIISCERNSWREGCRLGEGKEGTKEKRVG